ncbi:hypothetical protein RchiOBHm_Chr2g0131331 [Rosa chinensis]|uniref:Uncharacterized protein n=1 Tax=Rosa chinensis TaxID=74649 RepID=A0A2P6RV20_ROSCH|nr:hypothetical protein RchiOBHm_Chr2g0131331 [Rosa chinensis]
MAAHRLCFDLISIVALSVQRPFLFSFFSSSSSVLLPLLHSHGCPSTLLRSPPSLSQFGVPFSSPSPQPRSHRSRSSASISSPPSPKSPRSR